MELPYFDVSEIINNILECYSEKGCLAEKISINDIKELCQRVRSIFLQEDGLLEIEAPVKILGNIHGNFSYLLEWFSIGGQLPYTNYLFLGDYINRGPFSVETIILLYCYKLKYPKNIYLLRGNHECASISRLYGFFDECKKKYNLRAWKDFIQCFDCMPLAAIVGGKIFCVHSGFGPELEDLKQINNIIRPTRVPEEGLLYDLLWKEINKMCIYLKKKLLITSLGKMDLT